MARQREKVKMILVKDGNGGIKVNRANLALGIVAMIITIASVSATVSWGLSNKISEIQTGVDMRVTEVKMSVAVLGAKFDQFLVQRAVIDNKREADLKELSELVTQLRIEVKGLR